jgi:hypothetical protein
MPETRSLACVSALLLAALCVGCADNVYVMSQTVEITDGERVPAGGVGCILVMSHGLGDDGASISSQSGLIATGPGGEKSDFSISERSQDDAFLIVVSSEEEELARRTYTEKQLLSGKHDQFTVTTHGGRTFELTYWGGDTCEATHLEEEQ